MNIKKIILTYRRENNPFLPLLTEEEVLKVIKWLIKSIFKKLNQQAWITIRGNRKVFGITTLGIRVNPSLLVFN